MQIKHNPHQLWLNSLGNHFSDIQILAELRPIELEMWELWGLYIPCPHFHNYAKFTLFSMYRKV